MNDYPITKKVYTEEIPGLVIEHTISFKNEEAYQKLLKDFEEKGWLCKDYPNQAQDAPTRSA